MFKALLYLAGLMVAVAVAAQQPGRGASGQAPAPIYESAFDRYQAYREESVADWRAVNDEVARIGGHAGVVGGRGSHGVTKPAATQAGQPPSRGAPQAPGSTGHTGRR